MGGKKTTSVRMDREIAEKVDKISRDTGKNKSQIHREALKDYFENRDEQEEEDAWSKIPESHHSRIKKMLECMRDYQLQNREDPIDFKLDTIKRLDGKHKVDKRQLEELIEVKWNTVKPHIKKFRNTMRWILAKEYSIDYDSPKLVLNERGKILMKSIKGGDYRHEEDN